MRKPKPLGEDPYNIHARLEKVIDSVLTEFEERPEVFAIKDKLYIIQYVGMFLQRKSGWTITDESDDAAGGSAVRKYAGAFRTNVARRGAANPRPTIAIAHDADDDPDDAA